MIAVANAVTGEILNRCDAWERNGLERMRNWAKRKGYGISRVEITQMGDMIIWVTKEGMA